MHAHESKQHMSTTGDNVVIDTKSLRVHVIITIIFALLVGK